MTMENEMHVNGTDTVLSIERLIFMWNGQQVMLDKDLARLYSVETRVLKQAVRRNLEKFPEDFMFRLSPTEVNELIFNGG